MKKISVISIFLFVLFIMCSNIFAYNLSFKSEINDNYIYFYTVVKAAQSSIKTFDESR